jgi:hypothetical protein
MKDSPEGQLFWLIIHDFVGQKGWVIPPFSAHWRKVEPIFLALHTVLVFALCTVEKGRPCGLKVATATFRIIAII